MLAIVADSGQNTWDGIHGSLALNTRCTCTVIGLSGNEI